MEFEITQEVSEALLKNGKSDIIDNLSNELKTFFKKKNYGNDVLSVFIGLICVSPEFDFFFKTRKPKYKKGKEIIVQDNVELEIESALRFDIKINFEDFKNAKEEEAKRILTKEILASLTAIEMMKGKIKDFDLEAFKSDLVGYFQERKLLPHWFKS